ncbi:ABC transporter [Microbacterium paraoxydans]|uniref:ABC transporter n=1 Tax=Microbacterium paraoxydans TaxID=199592 RepID=UPI0022867615|nr:ABC transporter [Microbacterium paraoxydans]MCZ0709300.1 ABC transporter [Microbacterium paraoxydans]
MSDPEARQPEKSNDVDDVVGSANAGLDAAAAARGDVPGHVDDARADDSRAADTTAASSEPAADQAATRQEPAVDPDLAAFEAAERDHPGTFSSAAPAPSRTDGDRFDTDGREAGLRDADRRDATPETSLYATPETSLYSTPSTPAHEESAMAGAAYASHADDTDTRIVPSEPLTNGAAAAPQQPQPIFVQAPEPPRERGNRGTAGAIGLLATVAFALLYLATTLGLGALAGDVNGENIGEALVAPLLTWGFWTPVVVFFLGFWLLGAIINRGRWGLWVVFGIVVGLIAYAGHILGQLFEAPFWKLTASQGLEVAGEQLLAPLAIAAFVFARELTIWFGAWVARSGARKTELNEEAQREYERTLEAGPTLSR